MLINLRPTKLVDFKGNDEIKSNIQVYIDSSKKNKKPFEHTLIYGLPGTGKTTLAMIIANELGKNIKIVQGGNLVKNTDVINLVLSINEGDVIFIDEIHAVSSSVVELLYTVMEDYMLDITFGKDFNAKTSRIKVPHFTLVGATTMFGKISSPLEGRFGIIIKLKNYDIKTLKEIVSSSCEKLNLKLTEEEIETIASNSKLIPRNANRIVRRVHDFRTNDEKITIDEILVKLNIGKNGLDTTDLEYLSILKEHNCSVGIKTLSSILNVDVNTVETKIEPFLLFCGYIIKSSKGRNISIRGLQFMLNSNNVQTEFKNELFA